jgi:DNA invertase Pin-like site-specific DNA recombinase
MASDIIYARQSVDREDSISIESQIEFCMKETTGGYKVYQDKGYSGKNTERPAFQEMMAQIRCGDVTRVIVYKLDRISRSVLDFASLVGEFQKYGVEFISATERFDTSTPVGKAMLMIVMIFAQLERETIQQRVIDSYRARSRRGFYMGGRVPYGFLLQDVTIDGIKTSMYKPNPEEIDAVELIYNMYANPQTSLGDVGRYLYEHGIKCSNGNNITQSRLRDIIMNPIYVKADSAIFDFFRAQGTEIINDITCFVGDNGAYLYSKDTSPVEKNKYDLSGNMLVLAPHKGVIDSDTWIRCRRKCLSIRQIAKPMKAKNTWLAGKIKCAKCGYALSTKVFTRKSGAIVRYYYCRAKHSSLARTCEWKGTIRVDDIEEIVLDEIKRKLSDYSQLSPTQKTDGSIQISKTKLKIDLIAKEIEALIDKIPLANVSTMNYINSRIDTLNNDKILLSEELAEMTATMYGSKDVGALTGYMEKWEELTIQDKLIVVDALINQIRVAPGAVDISWKL